MRAAAPAVAVLAAAVLGAACTVSPASAQSRSAPDLIESPSGLSQRPINPLTGPQVQRLLEAQAMRETGRLDAARETLQGLLAESPHQALVLGELGRVYASRQQWPALEKLARAERAATRDSLLLGHELALALERQSRPREAARVVIEVWSVSPGEGEWCEPTVARYAETESRPVREMLRRAAEARPQRQDLVRAAARLDWRHGDSPSALRLLAAADATGPPTPTRWTFAEELLFAGTAKDTTGAIEMLIDLAADRTLDPAYRLPAARRAWQVYARRDAGREGVLRISRALTDLPPNGWSSDLLVGIVRGLREAGYSAEVRALLDRLGDRRTAYPELALEGALNELREGPPASALPALERAAHGSPEGVFRYAEALFFAGMADSAAVLYRLVSHDPKSPFTGPALERMFLIEDADPRSALPGLGRMAYESWRGEPKRAAALADSMYRTLPRGALWAHAALELAAYRDRSGDGPGALQPLLMVADSLPDDRLASLARQRAGDVYRRLGDDAKALAQYEECLARYPKAWNAPEVRRSVEALRRDRRF